MKKILAKYWPIISITVLGLSITWPLFVPGYFSHHDNLQVMRLFEMRRCFNDLQIPCRWVPDMGYGNGFPLFNYYNVLPYYLGAVLSFFTSFIVAAKILFFIPALLGGIFMFILAKELFDEKSALVTSVLFTFAPYRALDLYVRGDVTESFAIALSPLIFYLALRAIREKNRKFFVGFSISLALLLLSHNIMSVFFIPFLVVWILFWMYQDKGWGVSIKFIRSFVFGIMLSTFFIIPAFFEKSLVQIDNLTRGDLNFRAQFTEFNQLFFSRFWGYGASVPGPNDTISFQIGWPHWWLVGILIIVILLSFGRVLRLQKKETFLGIFLSLVFLLSVFMTHNKSAFIWEKIGILRFAQFPWRFLSVAIFSSSLIGGLLISLLKNRMKLIIMALVCVLTVALNFSFFRPGQFFIGLTDQQMLTGPLWEDQQKAAILDYLPVGATEPEEKAPILPLVRSGHASVTSYTSSSNSFSFPVAVATESIIEVPIFDFPNWATVANGQVIPNGIKNQTGRISINLPPGNYEIKGNFENTPIRTISNFVSAMSWLGLILFLVYGKIRKIYK